MADDTPTSLFTKLIVDDEEKMTDYYCSVYGLDLVARVEGDAGGMGEPFREVILGTGKAMDGGQTLVMFKFLGRPKPRDQQVILGFVTDDLDALEARISAHGGKPLGEIFEQADHGVRVLFAEDPEGALTENVQMLAP